MEEAEWAIEVMKELGVPVACTMRVGPTGDFDDVSPQWRIQDFPNGGGAVLSQMGGRTSCFQVKSA